MKKYLRFISAILIMVQFSYIAQAQVIDESFESWPPANWTIDPSSGSGSWNQGDGSDHGPGGTNIYDGFYAAMFANYDYSTGTTGSIITPTFDLSSRINPTLSFYWWNDDGSSTPATLDVYSTSDGTTWSLIDTIDTYGSGATTWVHYTHTLANDVVKIKLTATSDWGLKNTFVDKFVIDGAICSTPSNQTTSSITSTSASLDWTENGSTNTWNIEYGPAGYTQGSGTTVSVTSKPYSLTGLSSGTNYDWYVQSDCGGGSASSWVGPNTFTTTCGSQSTPYNEGFEHGGDFPNCWEQSTTDDFDWTTISGSTPTSGTGPSAAHGGTYYIYTESSQKQYGDIATIYSSTVDLSGLTIPRLNFWYHMYGTAMDNGGSLEVAISTDGGSSYTAIWSETGNKGNQWNNALVNLSSYSGNVIFRIKATISSSGGVYYNDFAIDDFNIEQGPSCPDPTNQSVGSTTLNSVDLSWTENGSATNWDIEYGSSGFTQGSGTQISVTANPYTLSGLTAGTSYDWYVRANCGAGNGTGTSAWIGPNTYTTADGKATNPNPTDGATEILVSATTLDWDNVPDATGYHISVGTSSGGTDIVNNASINGGTNSSYTVSSNWSYSTTYYWTVKTDYSGGQVIGDEWNFTTACAPVTTFPLHEDFEHSGNKPDCWSYVYKTGTQDFTYEDGGYSGNPVSAHNGSYNALLYHNSTTADITKLVSPELDLSGLTNPVLTYWHVQAKWNSDQDELRVYYKTSVNGSWTLIPGQEFTSDISNWQQQKNIALPNPSSTYYIAFEATAKHGYGVGIDDVLIGEQCLDPTNQTSSNATSSGADLAWIDLSGSNWDVYVVPQGDPAPTQTTIPTADDLTTQYYTYTGGAVLTTYDWYVRSDCGQDNIYTSDWVGPAQFTTTNYTKETIGQITNCSPHYVRDGGSGNFYFYDKYNFTVSITGNYDITADWRYTGYASGFDGYLYLYAASFDSANPSVNLVASNDDYNSDPKYSKIQNQVLSSGTTYVVVGTHQSATVPGLPANMSFTIEGPSVANANVTTDYNGLQSEPTHPIPPTDGTVYTSDYGCDDSQGWTNYYDDMGSSSDYSDDKLLLSVKRNENNLGLTTVTVAGSQGVSKIKTNAPYTNTFVDGWYVFNRYWTLIPTVQPSSDVQVRFYYKDVDFTNLQTTLTAANKPNIPNSVEDLSVIKINSLGNSNYDPNPANGHYGIPKATAYDADGAWIYNAPNGSAPASTKWIAGTYESDHYFEFTVAHFSGGGGGASGEVDDGTLPIELLSFNAFTNGDINQVVWKTATEFNVEKFIVERLDPVTQKIEEIGDVKAVGNSNTIQSYSFDDTKPLEEAYYRIHNVDYDGASDSFDWVFVKRGSTEFKLVNLYPNPATNTAHIEIVNPTNHKVHFELRDMVGKLVFSKDYEAKQGLQTINLDLSTTSAGTYSLAIDNSQDRIIKLLIIR